MGQGVLAGLRAYNLSSTVALVIGTTEEDTEKTGLQFWKDRSICDCIRDFAWARDDVTKECMERMWKKTLKRLVYDVRGFAKDAEVAKIHKAVIELSSPFHLGVDEDDTESP